MRTRNNNVYCKNDKYFKEKYQDYLYLPENKIRVCV
jgi:hypothetical protein